MKILERSNQLLQQAVVALQGNRLLQCVATVAAVLSIIGIILLIRNLWNRKRRRQLISRRSLRRRGETIKDATIRILQSMTPSRFATSVSNETPISSRVGTRRTRKPVVRLDEEVVVKPPSPKKKAAPRKKAPAKKATTTRGRSSSPSKSRAQNSSRSKSPVKKRASRKK